MLSTSAVLARPACGHLLCNQTHLSRCSSVHHHSAQPHEVANCAAKLASHRFRHSGLSIIEADLAHAGRRAYRRRHRRSERLPGLCWLCRCQQI